MTIQQIIAMADELYPNAVSPQTKIAFLNTAMDELSQDYGRFVESNAVLTVDGQQEYNLPSDCIDISHVVSIWVPNTTTPTSDDDYVEYRYTYQSDLYKENYTYYDAGEGVAGVTKSFGLTPIPDTDNYPIKIRYRKLPPTYSIADLAVSPDIDARWHDSLAYYIIYMCASGGTIPQEAIANFWGNKFNESIEKYKIAMGKKANDAPKKRLDNGQWHEVYC